MILWLTVLVVVLSIILIVCGIINFRQRKQLSALKYKITAIENKFNHLLSESADREKRYDHLKERSKKVVKDLRTEVFKLEHKAIIAYDSFKQVNEKNELISKKMAQFSTKKEAQISAMETELVSLRNHVDLPTTSIDQMNMLKDTVARLDNILQEEHKDTDSQLLKLEKRLLELSPSDLELGIAFQPQIEFEDDLTEIVGIGPKLATILKENGIVSFRQLAELNEEQISKISEMLGEFGDRITRDKWIEQAKELYTYRH